MSQPQQMNMGGMGGPVGGAPPQQQNVGTPSNGSGVNTTDSAETVKRLNTYIYDYFLRNQHYDIARAMITSNSMELLTQTKQSPSQRQNQPNGMDDVDPDRPKDLPEPGLQNTEGPFLQDWWFQFWDIYNSRRNNGSKPSTLNYLTAQRAGQKQRGTLMGGMDPGAMQNMRQMSMMSNGMMPNDLKKAAMQNAGATNMTPQQQMAQMQRLRAAQGQQQMMPGQQMERSNSQMEMNGPRSGSPGSGDAPSPKRQRMDGNVQQMGQRPGQPGQMPNAQGMPPNVSAAMGPAGAQGSPLSQAGIDPSLEFAPNGAMRPGMVPGTGAVAAGAPGGPNSGNHALQDYQMQLMLLEQQNKKRLLMARQEQDSMSSHPGMPPGANEMFNRAQMMPNGTFPGGGQPMPPNMMPGGPPMQGQQPQPQQPGQGPPNMTPRQGNQAMPPPPAPQPNATGGTQPSSPAAAPAPPTPNQSNKAKPGTKKDNKSAKAASKKGGQTGATPASESEQPPTPTPATPITPMNANSFQKQQIAPSGMPNGAQQQQPQHQQQQPNQNTNGVQQQQAPTDISGPFGGGGNLVGGDESFGMNMDFADVGGGSGDVLDTFDFDSFLNEDSGMPFDFNTFDGGLEAGGDGMGGQ